MTDEEFTSLVESIRATGQVDPIVKFEGQVLDGANRLRACEALGIAPRTTQFEGRDALAFVIAKNLERRHLTSDQRAMVGQALLATKSERQAAKAANDPNHNPKGTSAPSGGKTIRQAAAAVGVHHKKVSLADKVVQAAAEQGRSEIIQQVRSGALPLKEAAVKVNLPPPPPKKERGPEPATQTAGLASVGIIVGVGGLAEKAKRSILDILSLCAGVTLDHDTRECVRGDLDDLSETIDLVKSQVLSTFNADELLGG